MFCALPHRAEDMYRLSFTDPAASTKGSGGGGVNCLRFAPGDFTTTNGGMFLNLCFNILLQLDA